VIGVATVLASLALSGFLPLSSGPAGGEVLQGTFPGTVRPGLLYLPPGFTRAERYPVVYLLHGMPGSPSEYPDGTGLVTFADEAIAAGTVRPFIAVMPAAGPRHGYNGEWAGPWERGLVDETVPWVEAHLPTIAGPHARVIAGLSAGGYGAVDIALRHPDVFGTVESWSGYFEPLRDGPFRQADATTLASHDPTLLVRSERGLLRRDGLRFFVSSGPSHSHWFKESATVGFAHELAALGLPVELRLYPTLRGEWREQLAAGLTWAFPPDRTSTP
jgi:enterochelin esterase-like enzyme